MCKGDCHMLTHYITNARNPRFLSLFFHTDILATVKQQESQQLLVLVRPGRKRGKKTELVSTK